MVDYDKITNILLGLNDEDQKEVIESIKDYMRLSKEEKEEYFSKLLYNAKTYRDYIEMMRLTKTIDNFFNNEISYDEARDKLLHLKSIEYKFENTYEKVYNDFQSKVYDFVLLGMFVDAFDIDKNQKVKDVFYSKLQNKIDDIKNSIVPLPILIKEIDRVERSNNEHKYLDKKLLDKLFYYENNKDRFKNESKDSELYNKKKYYEDQKEKITKDLEQAKRRYKASRIDEIYNRIKLCLYGGTLIASIAVPSIFAFKYGKRLNEAKSLQHYDTQTIYEDNRVKVGEYEEYSTKYKELQTYLKEYTKINDDLYKVKTYDCSNIDVESLFDVIPDESNLVDIEILKNNEDMFNSVDTFKTIYKTKYNSTEKTDIEKSLERKLTISVILIFIFAVINMFNIVTQGEIIDFMVAEIFDLDDWNNVICDGLKEEYEALKEEYEDIKDKLAELDNNKDIASFNNKLSEFESIIDEELNELKKQKKIQI